MKVALVTEFYYPHLGGVTEHVYHLARYMTARGHGVRIVTNHVANAPRRADLETVMVPEGTFEVVRMGYGMPIDSNGSESRVTIGLGLDLRMRAALDGVDLVHVQSPLFPSLPFFAIKEAKRRGLPTVGTFHTNFDGTSFALKLFARIISIYSDHIDRGIAVSESARRSFAQFLKRDPVIIPNGVDVEKWAAPENTTPTRTIVFLGRLDPRNDVDVLIRAFTKVAEQITDARLVLVGDGPRRADYEALVPAHLRERIVFAGSQSSVEARASFLANADVMAFTARIVSHPMALIEGMASGRAVVGYDIEGVRELISDGREGYKVPVGDADALAGALVKVLEDDARRRVMGRLARARASQFDWSVIAKRIEELYLELRGANEVVKSSEPTHAPGAAPVVEALA